MPRRNTIRRFTEEGIYHVYNRGVEKRDIFIDEQDYAVFLHLLKYYLSPLDLDNMHPLLQFQDFSVKKIYPLANLEKEVDLITYCLMPNHFHLIIKQHSIDGVSKLLLKVATTYAMYFNKRYKRVGYLFQGPYRAVLVESESYLLHLSRYIHLNPVDLKGVPPFDYPYSSYKYFLGKARSGWIKPKIILDYFDTSTSKLQPLLKHYPSYQEFVEGGTEDSKEIIGNLALE